MMTRLRVILPPGWVMTVFVVVYLLLEGPVLYFEHRVGRPLEVLHPGVFLARLAAFAYGFYRVRAFHPALMLEYRAWLERTPWTSRKPLPGGPVAFVWGDGLVFALLAAAVGSQGFPSVLAVWSLALMGHSAGLASSLFWSGPKSAGYLVAFGVGLAARLWPDRLACLATALATDAVGLVGLRLALARFPWPGLPSPASKDAAAQAAASCGWPFDQLRPSRTAETLERGQAVALSLLAGWYFYAAEGLLAEIGAPAHIANLVFVQGVAMMAIGRGSMYCQGYAPPISLWGRVRSFRWIIPGYDQVFLAPLCVALIGLLALDRFRPEFLTDEVALAVGWALAMLVSTTAGPDLLRWRLTGHHRIVPSNLKKAGQELIRVG